MPLHPNTININIRQFINASFHLFAGDPDFYKQTYRIINSGEINTQDLASDSYNAFSPFFLSVSSFLRDDVDNENNHLVAKYYARLYLLMALFEAKPQPVLPKNWLSTGIQSLRHAYQSLPENEKSKNQHSSKDNKNNCCSTFFRFLFSVSLPIIFLILFERYTEYYYQDLFNQADICRKSGVNTLSLIAVILNNPDKNAIEEYTPEEQKIINCMNLKGDLMQFNDRNFVSMCFAGFMTLVYYFLLIAIKFQTLLHPKITVVSPDELCPAYDIFDPKFLSFCDKTLLNELKKGYEKTQPSI